MTILKEPVKRKKKASCRTIIDDHKRAWQLLIGSQATGRQCLSQVLRKSLSSSQQEAWRQDAKEKNDQERLIRKYDEL